MSRQTDRDRWRQRLREGGTEGARERIGGMGVMHQGMDAISPLGQQGLSLVVLVTPFHPPVSCGNEREKERVRGGQFFLLSLPSFLPLLRPLRFLPSCSSILRSPFVQSVIPSFPQFVIPSLHRIPSFPPSLLPFSCSSWRFPAANRFAFFPPTSLFCAVITSVEFTFKQAEAADKEAKEDVLPVSSNW